MIEILYLLIVTLVQLYEYLNRHMTLEKRYMFIMMKLGHYINEEKHQKVW